MAPIRQAGARIKFLPDDDVADAFMAASEDAIDTGVDLLFGVGGTPEGMIAAAALRCLGGAIFGRLDQPPSGSPSVGGQRPPRSTALTLTSKGTTSVRTYVSYTS